MQSFFPRKRRAFNKPSDRSWNDPLEGLLNDEPSPPDPLDKLTDPSIPPPRRRYYSPKRRPTCPSCNGYRWFVLEGDDQYRDPYLECGHCNHRFRMNLSPLDAEFAWRDGIKMPEEVLTRHENPDSRTARRRARRQRDPRLG